MKPSYIKAEVSTDQGQTWAEAADWRWRGTGELRPRWTKDSQPAWYRQTDMRTEEDIAEAEAEKAKLRAEKEST